jgi:hypothetical protein
MLCSSPCLPFVSKSISGVQLGVRNQPGKEGIDGRGSEEDSLSDRDIRNQFTSRKSSGGGFGMAAEELSPKRRSRRERVQTPKAVELNRKRRETHS